MSLVSRIGLKNNTTYAYLSKMTILQSLVANYLSSMPFQMVQPLCGSCNLISFSSFVGQKTSIQTIACCAVIVGGFWLGVDQENVAGTLALQFMF